MLLTSSWWVDGDPIFGEGVGVASDSISSSSNKQKNGFDMQRGRKTEICESRTSSSQKSFFSITAEVKQHYLGKKIG